MKRVWLTLALLTSAACGDAHLGGAGHGKKVRTAFENQAAEGRDGPAFDASDAKNTMTRHHATPGPQGQSGGTTTVPAVVPLRIPSGGSNVGNPGGAIKMDAKER